MTLMVAEAHWKEQQKKKTCFKLTVYVLNFFSYQYACVQPAHIPLMRGEPLRTKAMVH